MRDLERTFGVALFDRGNRGVTPTIYGEALVRHAQGVLAQVEHAAEEIDDLAHGAGGRVAIGTLLAASAWLLPNAISRLRAERPRVVIDVVEGTNDRLQPMLLRGDDDILWPVGVSTRKHARLSPAAEALLTVLRALGNEYTKD